MKQLTKVYASQELEAFRKLIHVDDDLNHITVKDHTVVHYKANDKVVLTLPSVLFFENT